MASRLFHPIRGVKSTLVVLAGTFTVDGAGAVSSYTTEGAQFTVTKPAATTGIYRINLGASTTYPDVYKGNVVTAIVVPRKTTAIAYKAQAKAHATTAAAPYVEVMVTTRTAAATSGAYNESSTTALADLVAAGGFPHQAGATPTLVTAANASDLATSKTLAQDIAVQFALHDDDENIHPAADTGNLANAAWASSPGLPADLAEVMAVANELKSDWNTHVAKLHAGSVDFHMGGDLRNTINSADADDQAKANTLLNELKKKFNRSVAAKPPAHVLLKTGGTQTQATVTLTEAAADPVSCSFDFVVVVDTGSL